MAKPSTDLHELIHAMDKQEKIWFRSRHQPPGRQRPDFVLLYDEIEAQAHYDEAALRKKLGKHPLVSRLAATKAYLYQVLLEDLVVFHRKNDPAATLRSGLEKLHILHKKGLRRAVVRLLRKLKMEASHQASLMLQVLEWERIHIGQLPDLPSNIASINQVHGRIDSLLRAQLRLNRLQEIGSSMHFLLTSRGKPRTQAELDDFRQLAYDPVLQEVIDSDPVTVKANALIIESLWYEVSNQPELSYARRKALADLYAARAHAPDGMRDYLSSVNNLMVGQIAMGKFEECSEYLQKLRNLTAGLSERRTHRQMRLNVMVRYYIFRLLLAERTQKFEDVLHLESEISQLLELAHEIEDQGKVHLVIFNTACNLTALGRYSQAIQWWNRLLILPQDFVRKDLYVFTRLLHLLCHYSLGNFDMVRFLVPGIYRYLHKNRQMHRFEAILLDTFRKFNRIRTPRQERDALLQFRAQLHTLFQDPAERRVLEYFDMLRWLDSRLPKQDAHDNGTL